MADLSLISYVNENAFLMFSNRVNVKANLDIFMNDLQLSERNMSFA